MFLLSILILVVAVQAVVLDFFLLSYIGRYIWILVGCDCLLLCHLTVNFRSKNTAFKCASQWMIYSWLLALKLGIYYFQVFPQRIDDLSSSDIAEILSLADSYGFFIIVFITPVTYTFWVARCGNQLLGSMTNQVSLESILFIDLALHVVFDLLDVTVCFQLSSVFTEILSTNLWLYNTNGVLMILGLIFHSFSMPTWCSRSAEEDDKTAELSPIVAHMHENDVYLTRKHVALVSMFILDIPLLFLRIYMFARWLEPEGAWGFNFFTVKNIIDLPLSTYRLNQCRMAEKELSRSAGKRGKAPTIAPSPQSTRMITEAPINGAGQQDLKSPQAPATEPEQNILRDALIREVMDHRKVMEAFMDSETGMAGLMDQSNRTLPVRGFTIAKVFGKFTQCVSTGGRHSLAERLDTGLNLPYWKTTGLALSMVLFWTTRLVLVGLYAQPQAGRRVNWTLWTQENLAVFILSFGSAAGIAVCYLGSAPLFDIAFAALLWFTRNMSFFGTLWVFRDTHLLDLAAAFELASLELPGNIPWEEVGVWCFTIPAVFSLLSSLFYVQSAFLNRRFSYFMMQPRNRTARRLAFQAHDHAGPKSDEIGWISTASILTYLNCKYHMAPVSLNDLLIGPDLVKAVRLSDVMLYRDWMHFAFVLVTKAFTFVVLQDRVLSFIFLSHLALELVYIFISQTYRLLALRRFETKSLYTDLVWTWNGGVEDPAADISSEQASSRSSVAESTASAVSFEAEQIRARLRDAKAKRTVPADRLADLSMVLEWYKRQAFLTAPGETLLPLRP